MDDTSIIIVLIIFIAVLALLAKTGILRILFHLIKYICIGIVKILKFLWRAILKPVLIFIFTVVIPLLGKGIKLLHELPERCIETIFDRKITWEQFNNRILIPKETSDASLQQGSPA